MNQSESDKILFSQVKKLLKSIYRESLGNGPEIVNILLRGLEDLRSSEEWVSEEGLSRFLEQEAGYMEALVRLISGE